MSEIDKAAVPTKLLWVDLEMTGLQPEQDVILEVAVEITDFQFTPLASYQAAIAHPTDIVTMHMENNPWWQYYPKNREELILKTSGSDAKPLEVVEQELMALVSEQFGTDPAVLAGNSIYNDRCFIKHWWPQLDTKLHYRMLDVSTWKVWMQGAYGVKYEKKEVHRAFEDIQASIAELQHYLVWFKQ